MVFRVEIAPQAFHDLDQIAGYIEEREGFAQAEEWFNSIIDAIQTLQGVPSRCAIAEEFKDLGREVRLLLHGKRNRRYKIYYAIQADAARVHVFHIRHWAQKALNPSQIQKLINEDPG